MSQIFFRLATDADAPTIEGHVRASVQEAKNYRGSIQTSRPDGVETTFVAGLDDVVLGSAVVVLSDDGHAHLNLLYVEPTAREVGIGDRMLSGVLQQLRDWGCPWVSGSALPGDRQTKNLFERHGLVAQTIIVGRQLSGSSTAEDASR